MCARRSGNIFFFFFFFFYNLTGSKATEPYKMDVSFLCRYTIPFLLKMQHEVWFCPPDSIDNTVIKKLNIWKAP